RRRTVTGIGLPVIVGEIVIGDGIVMLADILITEGNFEIVAFGPTAFKPNLLNLVDTVGLTHGQHVAADQAIVDEGRGIAIGTQAGGIGQIVATRHDDADIGAVGAARYRRTITDVYVDGGKLAAGVQLRQRLIGVEHEGQLVGGVPLHIGAE